MEVQIVITDSRKINLIIRRVLDMYVAISV
jgi:hypothetical protein